MVLLFSIPNSKYLYSFQIFLTFFHRYICVGLPRKQFASQTYWTRKFGFSFGCFSNMEKGAWLSYDKFNVILEYIVTDEKSFNELFNIADIIWETDQNLETL